MTATGPRAVTTESIPLTDAQELLDQMANLVGDQERRQFFDLRPELVSKSRVQSLCTEVARQVSIDAERAIELAATARFMSELLGDDRSRALSARAAANAFQFARESEQAQQLYETALELFSDLGDEVAEAVTRSSALHNLAYLGRYEQVYSWEVQARDVFERHDDRLRLAILDHNLAIILGRQDKFQESLLLYQRAFEQFESLDRPRDAAICLRNAAVCHVNLHEFREALELYGRSRHLSEQQGLPRLVMEVNYNTAYLHYLQGEYTRAVRLYRQARQQAKELGDEYHRALCDLGLTETYLELNLTEEAVELARSAYRAFDRQKLPLETAKALTNRAIAVSFRGQVDLASSLLDQARKIFVQEENRLWPALIDFYRAVILARVDRTAEAIELAQNALTIFGRSAAESRAVMCELLLSRLHLSLREVSAARTTCRAALRRLEGLELPALEYRAFRVLGEIEEAAGDRAGALSAYQRSHRWLEQLRSQIHGDDLKISFFKDKQPVYESLVCLTLENGETEGGAEQDPRELAFDYIEKAKSRSLADLIAFRSHALRPRDEGRSELAEKVRDLREELNWYYRQIDLRQMSAEESARREIQHLRSRAREREDELLREQRELQSSDRELSSIQNAAMVDLDTIRSSLPAESALVEYFIARDTVYAAVVDQEVLTLEPVSTARKARELHRFLQFQLSRTARLAVEPSAAMKELAAEATRQYLSGLYDELIRPIESRIGQRQLIIAPHGFLHYVPFHALLDADGRALIERQAISYAPSASVFHLCATKEIDNQGDSLVMGVANERAPHITEEAEAVAGSLEQATLLLGEDASEDALRRHAHGCRFVHVATHGLFRSDNPMFSAIQLGTSRLALFDLYSLRLEAELVVLSGCGTGLNAVLGADELLGLTRGLLYAGAQSLVVTLWDVHDASTTEFMVTFYRQLRSGKSLAGALRSTMLEHRSSYPDPYYWAPFVLVGKP